MRLFGAAQIPVDTRRYNADDKTQKMLRSTSKARLQQKREAMTAVRARMQRTWPEAMAASASEPPVATVAENGAEASPPDELEQLMEIDDHSMPEDAESARLIDLCQRSQIHVTDRDSGQRDVPITNG